MTKINVKKTDVAQAASVKKPDNQTKGAPSTIEVSDDNGRQIKVRLISALDSMRLTRLAGQDAANASYMMYATIAASVVEISHDSVSFPRSSNELEAIVQRLDNAGVIAVAEGLKKLAGVSDAEDQEASAQNLR